jgi:hypothetical protein
VLQPCPQIAVTHQLFLHSRLTTKANSDHQIQQSHWPGKNPSGLNITLIGMLNIEKNDHILGLPFGPLNFSQTYSTLFTHLTISSLKIT